MTTGDLKNNLRKLQAELKAVNYTDDIDFESLGYGTTAAFLPIYHYIFLDYSRALSTKIADMNVEMLGKTDLRFIEAVYKVLREMFAYKPPVTKDQFFAPGFGERKVIMCTEVLKLLRVKNQSLVGAAKPVSGKLRPTQSLPLASKDDVRVSASASEMSFKKARVDNAAIVERTVDASGLVAVPRVVNERAAHESTLPSRSSTRDNPQPQTGRSDTMPLSTGPALSTGQNVRPMVASERAQNHAVGTVQTQLLEAFGKINGSVDQICRRLEALDTRLARLESMEKQLASVGGLERRVTDVEGCLTSLAVSASRQSNESAAAARQKEKDDSSERVVEHVTGQLDNLMARLTLVENKLTMLQSAQVQNAQVHDVGYSNSQRFPSPVNVSPRFPSLNSNLSGVEVGDALVTSEHRTLSPVTSAEMTVDNNAATAASVSSVLQSEQLNRIQAMLRGTEEMLKMNSFVVLPPETSSSPLETTTTFPTYADDTA